MKDLHIHSTFSDGKSSPEEMILFAIERGLSTIGFSDHSDTPFDSGYCMTEDMYSDYKSEIKRLCEKYKGRIEVLCGLELDIHSAPPKEDFDYIIGSCHYVKADGEYIPVDKSLEDLKRGSTRHFLGDYLAYAECYYKTIAEVCEKTNANIIGHFDLLCKFNDRERLIDEDDPRYIKAWRAAADKLLASGAVFEVNTGVIGRGYRSHPYPAAPILKYLKENGAKFILSSDSHRADTIGFEFEKWEEYLERI